MIWCLLLIIMMEKEKTNIGYKVVNWIVGILFLVLLILCGYGFYYIKHLDAPEVIEMHDTITIRKDSIIEKIKFKTKFDTIIETHYKDTVLYDTIEIPIEHKVDSFTIIKDSLTISEKIHHSGFHSIIDSVELNYDWKYTFQPKKQKKVGLAWYIGPYVGYGINFNNGQYYFSPEIGIGGGIGLGGIIPIKQKQK